MSRPLLTGCLVLLLSGCSSPRSVHIQPSWIEAENAAIPWQPEGDPIAVALQTEGRPIEEVQGGNDWLVPEARLLDAVAAFVRPVFSDATTGKRVLLRILHTRPDVRLDGQFKFRERLSVVASADLRYYDANDTLRYWKTATALRRSSDFVDNKDPAFHELQTRMIYGTQLEAITALVGHFLVAWHQTQRAPAGAPDISVLRAEDHTLHLLLDGAEMTMADADGRPYVGEIVLRRLVSTVAEAARLMPSAGRPRHRTIGVGLAFSGLGFIAVDLSVAEGNSHDVHPGVIGIGALMVTTGVALNFWEFSDYASQISLSVGAFREATSAIRAVSGSRQRFLMTR